MTKKHRVKDVPKKQGFTAKLAEKFPSPPKKDGTKDPENILAKKWREEAEAKQGGKKDDGKKGDGKKGGGKKGGSSSGSGKKS